MSRHADGQTHRIHTYIIKKSVRSNTCRGKICHG